MTQYELIITAQVYDRIPQIPTINYFHPRPWGCSRTKNAAKKNFGIIDVEDLSFPNLGIKYGVYFDTLENMNRFQLQYL